MNREGPPLVVNVRLRTVGGGADDSGGGGGDGGDVRVARTSVAGTDGSGGGQPLSPSDKIDTLRREQEAIAQREMHREGPVVVLATNNNNLALPTVVGADRVDSRNHAARNDEDEDDNDDDDVDGDDDVAAVRRAELQAIRSEQQLVARREINREGPAVVDIRLRAVGGDNGGCLLYTSPSPRDRG